MLMEYKVIRRYPNPPRRGKRCKTIYTICRWSYKEQLKVGGLYANLGPGSRGLQRVLSVRTAGEIRDDE